jgi:uncharacterized protein YegJ (DUF2314 family)
VKSYLKKDERYSVEEMNDSTWCRVKRDDKNIALCMNKETARQVIYRDINSNGGECEYLYENDFIKEKTCITK